MPENVFKMLMLIPHAKMYPFFQVNLDFKAIDSLGITMNKHSSTRQIWGCSLSEQKKDEVKIKKAIVIASRACIL